MSDLESPDSTAARLTNPGLLLLLALVSANLLRTPTLESARPLPEVRAPRPGEDPAQVVARLWEDPLEAGYRRFEELGQRLPEGRPDPRAGLLSPARLRQEIAESEAAGRSVQVMSVMLPGGDYAEDRERRIRFRYAVVSALTEAGYEPVDARHVDVLRLGRGADETVASGATDEDGLLAPFEWYDHGGGEAPGREAERVVLVWMDDVAVGNRPLTALAGLLNAILPPAPDGRPAPCVVGPFDSGRLADLLRERDELAACRPPRAVPPSSRLVRYSVRVLAEQGRLHEVLRERTPLRPCREDRTIERWLRTCGTHDLHAAVAEVLRGVLVLSPTATAPLEAGPRAREALASEEPPCGVHVVRTIATDPYLAELLVHELGLRLEELLQRPTFSERPVLSGLYWLLRGVGFIQPVEPSVRIALVTEQDTTYGRYWLDNLGNAWDELLPHAEAEWVHVPYYRVIDGRATGAAGRGGQAGEASSDEREDDELPDYPVGTQQFDYVRRLERDLESAGEFDAIGILGTDVYDKLLLIETLRFRFPQATLFTTDLDARLFHPRHLGYTRNLIVASHQGLAPSEPTPPDGAAVFRKAWSFRGVYQTSIFRTVHAALSRRASLPLQASVYEIGSSGPVRLRSLPLESVPLVPPPALAPSGTVGRPAAAAANRVEDARAEDPQLVAPWTSEPTAWVVFGLLIVVVVFFARAPFPRAAAAFETPGTSRCRRLLRAWTLVTIGCLGLLMLAIGLESSGDAEPVYLFEGISLWPTALLRLVGAFFSVGALVHCIRALGRTQHEIEVELLGGAGPATPRSRTRRGAWRRARELAANVSLRAAARDERREIPIREAWERYRRSEQVGPRLARVVLWSIGYYVALVPLYMLLGSPKSPFRGSFSYLIDKAVVFAGVVTLFLLIFFVLSATVSCNRFIRELADLRGRVAVDSVVSAWAERRGLAPAQAVDDLRVELVRRLTGTVEGLVYFPSVAIGILIVARSEVFDDWSWPAPLLITFGIFFVFLVLCAWSIRRLAGEVRKQAVEGYRAERIRYADQEGVSKRLGFVLERLAALREGAFSSLLEHPLLRSVLVPFAALGSSSLLDYLSVATRGA